MVVMSPSYDLSNGFDASVDIFGRKKLFEQILNISNKPLDINLVLALDDKWGNGKTTFVKMMEYEIKKNHSAEIDVIYFDAFENDYKSDPFTALSSKIYSLINEDATTKERLGQTFLSASKKVGAALLLNGSKAIISTLTAGMVSGSFIEKSGDTISNSLASPLEKFIEERIAAGDDEEANIENFKKTLNDIYKEKNKKTIFIIDELDRARPDFSLELLEKIKHIFSVNGFVFLLVMNRTQFQKVIEHRYGKIDSKMYLNKFIHFWFYLPKKNELEIDEFNYNEKSTTYNYLMNIDKNSGFFSDGGVLVKSLSYLLDINGCSLREAERCISILSLIDLGNISFFNFIPSYQSTFALIAFLKVYSPELLDKIICKSIGYDEVINALKINYKNGNDIADNLSLIVSYILLSHKQRRELDPNGKYRTLGNYGALDDILGSIIEVVNGMELK